MWILAKRDERRSSRVLFAVGPAVFVASVLRIQQDNHRRHGHQSEQQPEEGSVQYSGQLGPLGRNDVAVVRHWSTRSPIVADFTEMSLVDCVVVVVVVGVDGHGPRRRRRRPLREASYADVAAAAGKPVTDDAPGCVE